MPREGLVKYKKVASGAKKLMNRLPVAPHGLILSVGGAVDARMLLKPVLDQIHVKI